MANLDNTKTNKALFKNTGIIAIGQISTKVVNFLLLPLYTALLTQEDYGIVDLLTTYTGLITVVIGLQMSQAIFRFLVTCRDDNEKKTSVISTVLTSTAVICVFYTLIFILVQPFIGISYKWYLLLHVIVAIFLQTASGIARGLGKNSVFALGNFISASTIIILNVLFIAVMRLGVFSMLWAYIIGPFVGGTFVILRCKVLKWFSVRKANRKELKTILAYSVPLVPNELSWQVIHASDRMVVSNLLSIATNGIIAVAAKFSIIYTTAFSVFNTSWTEQVVLHYKDEGGKEYINDMFGKMISFFASIAIGIIACMPFVFPIFVNKQFSEAYGVIPFYMIAVFFNAVVGLLSSIYLINNETKQVAISTAVAAAVNLGTDLALIKFIGMYAAPVSSILAYLTISIWRLIDVNRRHCRISMSFKNILFILLMLTVSLIGYYSNNILIQISVLVIIVILAFWINWNFLKNLKALIGGKKNSGN